MVAEQEGGDRYQPPADRPTSHRRSSTPRSSTPRSPKPRPPVQLRTSAVLALVSGLAITAPLALRTPRHEIALGPERTAPRDVEAAPHSDPASHPAGDPAAGPASATGDAATTAGPSGTRTDTSVSRDAVRSPAGTVVGAPSASSPDQAAAFEAQVVKLTNAQRTAHGCPALRTDHRLQLAAIEHSVDMQARDYFAHETPDGVSPWTRIKAQGYPDPSAENIAMGQSTPQAVVAAWMASPGHRANILNCASKAVGVGVRLGPGGPWWTQDFGRS